MNSTLNYHIGEYLNTEQEMILKASLVILQQENHFQSMDFWGKIQGISNDYYVAYGRGHDYFKSVKYFYSTNLLNWTMIPKLKQTASTLTKACNFLFTGIPSNVTHVTCPVKINEEWQAQTKTLKEEDRLASTIALITKEVFVIPIGALYLKTNGLTSVNSSFKGLSVDAAKNLNSYIHLENLRNEKQQFPYWNSKNSLEKDFPPESWIIHLRDGGRITELQSLTWPGYKLLLCPNTPNFIQFYIGDGRKNIDLYFI